MNTLTGAPSEQYYDATARPYKVRRVDGFEITDLDSDIVSFTNGLLQLKESSAPPAPPPDKVSVYAKEGTLRVVDSAGTETELGAGGGGGPFAPEVHQHVVAEITDFNDAVNGLVESNNNIATSQIVNFADNALTAAETSTAFALTEHTHETKEITDFTQGVINVTDPRYAKANNILYAIPPMFSNTLPTPYEVNDVSSELNPNTEAYRLFDRDAATIWHSGEGAYINGLANPAAQSLTVDGVQVFGQFVTVKLDGPTTICDYKFIGRDTANIGAPLNWKIISSEDGMTWTQVENRSSTFWNGELDFQLSAPITVRYVGFIVTEVFIDGDPVHTWVTMSGLDFFCGQEGHTHTTSDITDFTPEVNTLITSNTDAMAHTHTTSNITDFDTAVDLKRAFACVTGPSSDPAAQVPIGTLVTYKAEPLERLTTAVGGVLVHKVDVNDGSETIENVSTTSTLLCRVEARAFAQILINGNQLYDGQAFVQIQNSDISAPNYRKIEQLQDITNSWLNVYLTGVIEMPPGANVRLAASYSTGNSNTVASIVYRNATMIVTQLQSTQAVAP